MHVCTLSHFSCVQLSVTLRTVAHKAPLSMEFSRQEYWSWFSCPPPGDLPDPGVNPMSFTSPVLAGGFFTKGHNEILNLNKISQSATHLNGTLSLLKHQSMLECFLFY